MDIDEMAWKKENTLQIEIRLDLQRLFHDFFLVESISNDPNYELIWNKGNMYFEQFNRMISLELHSIMMIRSHLTQAIFFLARIEFSSKASYILGSFFLINKNLVRSKSSLWKKKRQKNVHSVL